MDAYRAGAANASNDALDRLTADELSRVAARAAERTDWTADDLNAAAMLHTDACLRLVKADRRADAQRQLDAAANLLHAAVDRDGADRAYAIRWRDTVAGLLHAFGATDMEAISGADVTGGGFEEETAARARSAKAWKRIRAAVAGR